MTKAFQKCKQSAQSLFHPTVGAGKTTNRDSINTKVFEEKGVGFGEGEEKLSEESFSSPSPMLPS